MNTQLTLFPEPTEPSTQSNPLSPSSPLPLSFPSFPSVKEKPSNPFASAFDHFTLEQRKQIIAWNAKHTYDETIDLIQKEFGIEVSRSSLARFHTRTALINHIEESPDTQAAADQILLHITSSKPNDHKLTAASIHILEQTAFKLALTSADKPAHLDLLNRVNLIICRARNTAVRERHATVQETKCALRSRELDLKALRLNPTLNLNPNLPSGGTRQARSASLSTVLTSSPAPRWSEAAAEPSRAAAHVAQTDCLPSTNHTSTSRAAITRPDASPADQKTSPHVAQNFSLPPSNHASSSCDADDNSTALEADPYPNSNHVNPVPTPNPKNQEPSVLSVSPSVSSVQPPPTPADPSDDPFLHIEGLLNGTIKPSWIPAEIPCDEEETFLDVWLRNRNKRLQAETTADTPHTVNPGNGP